MPVAPYGSWPSPLSAAKAAEAGIRHSEPWLGEDGTVWWLERRPKDGGRTTLVRDARDVTPSEANVRTPCHEYGGGAWFLHGDTAFFSNFADQRLYRLDPGEAPRPITPEPPQPGSVRYADGRVTPDGRLIVCVRETHGAGEPVNELVALPADGGGEPRVLASGRDFYAFPRVSPDGARLAWTCWDHPNMPWDGTELWSAPSPRSTRRELVAGGPGRVDLAARVEPGGRAPLRVRPRRLVEPLPRRRAADRREGRAGLSAVGLRRVELRVPGGRRHRLRARGPGLRAAVHPARGATQLEDLGLPYTAVGYPQVRSRAIAWSTWPCGPAEEEAVVTWDRRARGRRSCRTRARTRSTRRGRPSRARSSSRARAGAPPTPSTTRPTNPHYEAPRGRAARR